MAKYSLEVDTGLVDVDIKDPAGNWLGTFSFAPTDSNMAARFKTVVEKLNSVTLPEELNDAPEDSEEVMEFQLWFDNMIREQFDFLFDNKVSDGIFAKCGPLTFLENGDFYYEHVMEKIAVLVEKIMNTRMDAKLLKIKNATKKYDY